jgi:hypothetical protein
MLGKDKPDGGWEFVAAHDPAAELIGALLQLDDDVYTKTELAEAADVPLKTLYLNDMLETFADIGILERADGDGDETEACYCVNQDSDLLEAAAAFDDAYRTSRE